MSGYTPCAPSRQATMPERTRPFGWLLSSLLLLIPVLLWDASGLDLAVMRIWGTAQGFALKEQPMLSHWLHTRGQQAALGLYLLMLLMVWRPLGPWRRLPRRERAHALIAFTLSLLSISLLKRLSLTSCPWDLALFGGPAQWVSHWAWGTPDGGAGHCFPSGHASSAFGFLAMALPFLRAPDPRLQRTGRHGLVLLVVVGLVFGLTQTLRGAHYPSHTLWTAWICWSVGNAVYALLSASARTQPTPHP
ncbi:MAG: phosphatase PAP2 family protein [Betaproteobacteria bacterium]|nr:phosphatase PAP2 family protein [Betaproteobacteria bacterium]